MNCVRFCYPTKRRRDREKRVFPIIKRKNGNRKWDFNFSLLSLSRLPLIRHDICGCSSSSGSSSPRTHSMRGKKQSMWGDNQDLKILHRKDLRLDAGNEQIPFSLSSEPLRNPTTHHINWCSTANESTNFLLLFLFSPYFRSIMASSSFHISFFFASNVCSILLLLLCVLARERKKKKKLK